MLPTLFATLVMIIGNGEHRPECNRAYLNSGESALGKAVNVRYLAATPVGRLIRGFEGLS